MTELRSFAREAHARTPAALRLESAIRATQERTMELEAAETNGMDA